MVIKVYISGISGNKEVKKRQQRVLLILDSKNVNYEVIDIAEPGAEEAKDFVHNNATSMGGTISDPNPRHPLPPQIFNEDVYCGDYDQFDMANEVDEMEQFLKIEIAQAAEDLISNAEIKLKNGELAADEKETPKEEEEEPAVIENVVKENEVPNEQDVGAEGIPKEEEDTTETEGVQKTDELWQDEESKEDEELRGDEEPQEAGANAELKVNESKDAKENEENEKTEVDGSGFEAADGQVLSEQESASNKEEEKADEE